MFVSQPVPLRLWIVAIVTLNFSCGSTLLLNGASDNLAVGTEQSQQDSNTPLDDSTSEPNAAAPIASNSLRSFVVRDGNKLMLDGSEFFIVGPNIYWLGWLYAPNASGILVPPSHQNIKEAIVTAKLMGATVIRSHYLGISTGSADALEPSLNVYNFNAFSNIDYSLYAAAEQNIRYIIPLTDNYAQYTRSRFNFTKWRGITDGDQFFTDPNVISDFKAYISTLLTHVNALTGIALKDDPTILAWETGNELYITSTASGKPPESWTQAIAQHIKSLAPKHLVIDGSYGPGTAKSLAIPEVDIYGNHFYPLNTNTLIANARRVWAANKVMYTGEYDWTEKNGGDSLVSFLTLLETFPQIGDSYWSLFVRDDSCQKYVPHNDGFTLHYPGDDANMQMRADALRAHAYKKTGVAPPVAQSVPCP